MKMKLINSFIFIYPKTGGFFDSNLKPKKPEILEKNKEVPILTT